jgi:hypothetical protein
MTAPSLDLTISTFLPFSTSLPWTSRCWSPGSRERQKWSRCSMARSQSLIERNYLSKLSPEEVPWGSRGTVPPSLRRRGGPQRPADSSGGRGAGLMNETLITTKEEL